jgi:hypothetical protein
VAVEELNYALMARYDQFEIRQYAPYIVAETTVTGKFEWVGNVAFRRLAGYIFGKNRRQDSVAMTAPVIQEPNAEQIAMTAPVAQTGSGNTWVVTFVMPAEYTMETLPEPLDPSVRLSRRPGQLMAALTYSGSWRKSAYEKKRKQLEGLIKRHGYAAVGPAIFARYDPPFKLWFRRRNEVLIPVERTPEAANA